ncbi:hypothetical protein BDA99DRAFT_430680 [Phascolomyces articulosus]|uniref:Fungal lipase-type domain-containing protein n=1 Tax=Phascolomyces articulosus TaxID=60185 RepID=A0AAD5K967_9FUNG|nr:hypothetical protein BDA99DRAFT_430680 [Phascolomyces articulosus]
MINGLVNTTKEKVPEIINKKLRPFTNGLATGDVRNATQEEIATHYFYVELSASAYCRDVIPGGKFDCKHCNPSLELIKTFSVNSTDSNAMILRGDQQKQIIVVFRGKVYRLIIDAIFNHVDYPLVKGTRVHNGFLQSYDAVRDDILQVLNDQVSQFPDYKVAVTGHSLGGSMAVLCAVDLFNTDSTRYGVDKLLLYTQGQPRVGDKPFAEYVFGTGISHQRLVNHQDIVPHLPPAFTDYLHNGEEFWITDEGIEVCPNGLETENCANSVSPFTIHIDHTNYMGVNTAFCLY